MHKIQKIVTKIKVHSIIPEKYLEGEPLIFDFTKEKKSISNSYVTKMLNRSRRRLGIGKYGEDRTIYRSSLFISSGEARSVHLAIDLFVPTGTSIFAPLNGIIHSFQDNKRFLDYGPTIILEHNLKGVKFYTLYGHLSRGSLGKKSVGQKIKAGEKIANVGRPSINGNWPSHVHFQIITDMLGFKGDFPGVARPSEKEYYLKLCPDPNIILKLPI